MLKNYLKIALRKLQKNKLYSGINIIGLTIGLAACLLIAVFIRSELAYDQFHTNKNRIARVTMDYQQSGTATTTAVTGTKPGPQFKRTFPEVQDFVRTYIASRVVGNGADMFEEPSVLYADSSFFHVFSFPLVQGQVATALDVTDKIAISSTTAKKYFGKSDPINKVLKVGTKDFTVSAVFADIPQESQLKFDFVTRFDNLGSFTQEENWWTANWITYLILKDGASMPALQKKIDEFMKTPEVRKEARLGNSNDYLRYNLEPLTQVHLHSKLAGFEPNGNMRYIYIFSIIALLILVIACANYTNLAVAQSAARTGEIGMRKVMGASRRQVFYQFMGESALITLIAGMLSIAVAAMMVPYFNEITGRAFTVSDVMQPVAVVLLLLCVLIVTILAGIYPALVISGTGIMSILRKGFNFTGGNTTLRRTLIVAQFGISVFLIIYTGIILQQMKYMREKNLGYDRDHILVLPVDRKMKENFVALRDAIANVPGVNSVTGAYETPEFIEWGDGIVANDEKGQHSISLNALPVDLGFTSTMKMQMAAGRDFTESDFALMDTSSNGANFRQPYIINEALARKIGWTPEESIGRTIEKSDPGPVVGVVKDFHFESLHEPVKPLVMFLSRDLVLTFMVRISGNQQQAISRLETLWKERVPHRPFQYHFLDEDYNKLYQAEQRSATLFVAAATLAIVLGCLGLFGLAAFTTTQRVKEIGIRRVLGAGLGSIVMLIASNFLWMVGIAIVLAAPLAWYAGNRWLQDFTYRISVSAWLFGATAVVVVLIALLTVGYQAIKAAIANPVKNLRID
ncbi:MAG: ABC transporter permease [Sphingobacteriales bacterium]|jgi:putative ABC transport system permease protein|nr:ABC transporter permease [Sphingobacteriales bacterium]OJW33599.1 MAG: hypothetical protein BGO54_10140 [Sphingobacteriales bacterium 46-32]